MKVTNDYDFLFDYGLEMCIKRPVLPRAVNTTMTAQNSAITG